MIKKYNTIQSNESFSYRGIDKFVDTINGTNEISFKDYIMNNLSEFNSDSQPLLFYMNCYIYIVKMLQEHNLDCSDIQIKKLMKYIIKNKQLHLELIKCFSGAADYSRRGAIKAGQAPCEGAI